MRVATSVVQPPATTRNIAGWRRCRVMSDVNVGISEPNRSNTSPRDTAHEPRQTRCGGQQCGLADTTRPDAALLNLVLAAQTRTTREWPLAVGDRVDPRVDRAIGRDVDHIRPEGRVERRPVEQRGENLQSVLTLAVRLRRTRLQQTDTRDHRSSPNTV